MTHQPLNSEIFSDVLADAPLLSAYYKDREHIRHSFAIPGHKNNTSFIGDVIAADRPVMLSNSTDYPSLGLVRLAEQKAATLWGADIARFSVNGSSAANQAAMLGVTRPGEKVIISRTLHKSLMFGLLYAGVTPIWVYPDYDEQTGYPTGMNPETIRKALQENNQVSAVFIGEPSYVGTYRNLEQHADICHEYGVPLVVDAAWAAHFGFHSDLPRHALQAGADILVTSIHKTLPGFSQTAVLLAQKERVDVAKLDRMFDGTQTTSPSAALLASIDGSRALLASPHGKKLLGETISHASRLRTHIKNLYPTINTLEEITFDPMKTVFNLSSSPYDGHFVGEMLHKNGYDLEMVEKDIIIPQITLVDSSEEVSGLMEALENAFALSPRVERGNMQKNGTMTPWNVISKQVLPPREAWYAVTEPTKIADSVGRISAETIAPYPPGIPVLTPGEEITEQVLTILRTAQNSGMHIAYAADPSLETILTVETLIG